MRSWGRIPLALAAFLAGAAAAAPPAAAQRPSERPPDVSAADAAIVVDGRDGETMFAKRAERRHSIASATKLMTALLALERARPQEVFTAPAYDALPVESKIDLAAGERMRVQDLLEALLLESANDAAVALAHGISGSREAFVADMNARAAELGLENTSYANPIGLDHPQNYSTAADLAALTVELMRRPRFARIVDMPAAELESGARPRVVDNRNGLIAEHPWVSGVKTGYTLDAGYVLVGAATGKGGAKVVSVVLGEPSEPARDEDTLELLRWGLSRFQRVRVLDPRRRLATASIEYRDDERARLVPGRALTITLRDGERVRRRVRAPDELEGPLAAGARVGGVTVLVDGRAVRRVPLVTAAAVPEAGPLRVLTSVLGLPLTLLALLAILLAALMLAVRLPRRIRIVR